MKFRDFVEELKDAGEAMAMSAGARPIMPMLRLESHDAPATMMVVEPQFFDSLEGRHRLIDLIVRTVREHGTRRVAWLLEATVTTRAPDTDDHIQDVLMLVAMDAEVSEVWLASLMRNESSTFVAGWQSMPANETHGRLITPIQKELR